MASKPRKSTLQRAQDEVQELLLELEAGTLDRITLEAGLNKVQERLKAMAIHGFWFEPESKQDDDPAPNRRPRPK